MRITFDHTGKGLKTTDRKPPTGFEIAGVDGRFFAASARIDGDSVILTSPDVPAPVAVRYAWSATPQCNLVNDAGLPAAPFRTDELKVSTQKP